MYPVDNYILHGNDPASLFSKCTEIRKSIFPSTRSKINVQEVPNTNGSMMSTTHFHHEFDMICCYNSNSSTEYLNYIKHISSMNRIDNSKHLICIHNIHLMKPSLLATLKLMIQHYSDRTFFILSTSNISSIPLNIRSQCILIRCPGYQLTDIDTSQIKKALHWLLDHKSQEKAREIAYTFVMYNMSYTLFAMVIIDVCKERGFEYMHEIVQMLAENELSALKIKKNVMAWELTLYQLMEKFRRG